MKGFSFYLTSLVAGLLLGLFLPLAAGDSYAFLSQFTQVFLNVGTWMVLPLLMLQTVMGVYHLRFAQVRPYGLRIVALVVVAPLLFALLGILVVSVYDPDQLPSVYLAATVPEGMQVVTVLQRLVPRGITELFTGPLTWAPGVLLAGTVVGAILYELRGNIRHVVELGNGLYRLVTRINSLVSRTLSVLMVIPVTTSLLYLRGLNTLDSFVNLLLMLAGICIIFTVVVFPALVFFRRGMLGVTSYYRLMAAPWIIGLVTASPLTAYPHLFKRAQAERLSFAGQKLHMAFTQVLVRPGSAFALVGVFLVLIRSRTSLEISLPDMVLVTGVAAVASLFTGFFQGNGLLLGLMALSSLYGQGMGEVYMIVLPVIPLLSGMAVALDLAFTAFGQQYFDFLKIGVPDEQDREGSHVLGEFYLQ